MSFDNIIEEFGIDKNCEEKYYPDEEYDFILKDEDEINQFEEEVEFLNYVRQDHDEDDHDPHDHDLALHDEDDKENHVHTNLNHGLNNIPHDPRLLPLQPITNIPNMINSSTSINNKPSVGIKDLKDLNADSLDHLVQKQHESDDEGSIKDKGREESFTSFPSRPEANKRTMYPILKKIVTEHPHQFKVSTVEPYGEESETDSEGNRKIEKVENREFYNQDIIWFDSYYTPDKFSKMKNYQKINHFPGMYLLTRKNYLAKMLTKMRKLTGKPEQGFFPRTQLLPQQLKDMKNDCARYKREGKKKFFIVKPEGASQGKGIHLVRSWEDIENCEEMKCVVQKQLKKPLLIDGLKFDLRLQVLVSSMDPLRVFLHEDGFIRFCTNKYEEPTAHNIGNFQMHLTNQAINKFSKNFVQNANTEDSQNTASKRHISWFMQWLTSQGIDAQAKFLEVEEIIIKTLISVQLSLTHYQKCCQPNDQAGNMCFEVLGFDIIFDANFKPQLLEVNHAPSFATESPFDAQIKTRLLSDTFKILYLVGPRAKKAYQKFKQDEMNKKIIGKHKYNLEEKDELKRMQTEQKDAYALENLGGYKRIYPSDDARLTTTYQKVFDMVNDANNVQMKKKPKTNVNKLDKKVKPNEQKKPELVNDEKKVVKSKEEIQSIVNRLQQSRLNLNKVQQENFRQNLLQRDDNQEKQLVQLNTPVVTLNFNGSTNESLLFYEKNPEKLEALQKHANVVSERNKSMSMGAKPTLGSYGTYPYEQGNAQYGNVGQGNMNMNQMANMGQMANQMANQMGQMGQMGPHSHPQQNPSSNHPPSQHPNQNPANPFGNQNQFSYNPYPTRENLNLFHNDYTGDKQHQQPIQERSFARQGQNIVSSNVYTQQQEQANNHQNIVQNNSVNSRRSAMTEQKLPSYPSSNHTHSTATGSKFPSDSSQHSQEDRPFNLRQDQKKNRFPSAPHKETQPSGVNHLSKSGKNEEAMKLLNKLMNPLDKKGSLAIKPTNSMRKLIIPKPLTVHSSKQDNMELCVNGKGAKLSNSQIGKSTSENKVQNSILQGKVN